MKKLSLHIINPFVTLNCKRIKALKVFFMALVLTCIGYAGFAQVTVTPASGGMVICPQTALGGAAPACTTLGVITIAESGATGDFAIGADQLILNPPAGWQFCTGALPVMGYTAGADITALPTASFSGGDLMINFNVATTSRFDQITITGLQVQPTSGAAPAGYIFASSEAGISGVTTTATGTDFGNLMIAAATSGAFTVTGGGTYCAPGGSGVDVGLSSSTVGMNYQLLNGATLVSTLTGTGGALDFGLQTTAGTYTVKAINGCGYTATMTGSAVVVLSPSSIDPIVGVPGPIHSLCAFTDSEVVSDASTGGIWNSSLVTIVEGVPPGEATVHATSQGLATVTYTLPSGCRAMVQITVNPQPGPFIGPDSVCVGSTITLSDTLEGGIWSGTPAAIATIGSVTGIVTGIDSGRAYITYTMPTGCNIRDSIRVNPQPTLITGTTFVCAGSSTTLRSTPAGGEWESGPSSVATVIGEPGGLVIVTGGDPGTATVIYTLPTTCAAITTVTVDPVPGPITGSSTVCAGSSVPLTETVPGGSWTSSNNAVATVDGDGVVFGVTAGVDTISYTLSPGNCAVTFVITVEPLPDPITGGDSVCVGSSSFLFDSTAGGIWSTTNTNAHVDPTGSGTIVDSTDLTGNVAGTDSVIYTLPTGCATAVGITINALPEPIVSLHGDDSICSGNMITVYDMTAGGTWGVIDPSVATVVPEPDADTAIVTGGSPGITNITYTTAVGCSASFTITVDAVPVVPVGPASVCQFDSVTFTDATPGGTWSSSNILLVTIDTFSGVAHGLDQGTVTITYTGPGGCFAISPLFTVHPVTPIGATDSVVCQGSTITLINSTVGGTWSSSDNSIASVVTLSVSGGTATVTGGATPGVAIITYTTSDGCPSTIEITVNPITPVTGSTTAICVNDSTILSSGPFGGEWTTSDNSIASVTAFGQVYGVAPGVVTITYTMPTGCSASYLLTVNPVPDPISGPDSVCKGSTITLTDDSTGGVWLSSAFAVATAVPGPSTSSIITGVSAGTATISYTFPLTQCSAEVIVTVDPISGIFGADSSVCVLDSIQLNDTTAGGVWSSSNNDIATVTSTGLVTGVSAGTVTITYFIPVGACPATVIITVNPLPAAITGIDSVCVGNTTLLMDATTGGTWASNTTTIATVLDTAGLVTGVAAGTDIITYTLPTGCVITASVTVDALPGGITGDFSICNGDSTLLADASTGGVWSIDSGSAVATVTAAGYVKGLSPGTATIAYTLLTGGCPATIVVTVHPIPVITVPTPPAICKGASVTLSAFSPDITPPPGGYTWSPAYGLSNTGVPNPVASPTITTTYETIGTSQFGCRDSAFVTVTVDSALNHLLITGADSLCAGACETLTASGNPEALFSWHPSVGLSVTIGDTVVACPGVTTTYEAVAIDAMGCVDSASFTLTVNPIPQIIITQPTTLPVIVCRGTQTQIIASVTNADSNTTKYAWSPDILISCDSCDNPRVSDTFNLVYRVIATTIYGCYDSLNVKVSVLDTNVNTISNDTDICIGDSVMLVATSNSVTSNLDVPTYFWSPSTGLNFDNIQNPVATPVVTTTYSVTIRENACFTVVDTVTVRVQPLPAITITPASPITIISGTPTTLVAAAPNVVVASYLWAPGNTLNCDTCFDPVATPTAQTTYTVTVISHYGCVSTDSVTILILCDQSEVFVPNTFTPNGDGVNDRFFVSANGITTITNLSIFNRWGQLVFQAHNINANDPGAGWDGTYKGFVLEPDVFVYELDAQCSLGTPFHYTGNVSLIR